MNMSEGPVGSDLHPWFVVTLQKTVTVAVRAEDEEKAFALIDQHQETGQDRSFSLNNGWSAKSIVGPVPGKIGDDDPPEHSLCEL